ncbi:MAG: hypothetical protein NUW06_00550 [Candidatus Acetothermia bacterium]|nr:hypothetical protein [Candidatus Acetothermia bacterium]MDH7505004.1 hypothetical protein [Candidatus Acetothermia bacterium]
MRGRGKAWMVVGIVALGLLSGGALGLTYGTPWGSAGGGMMGGCPMGGPGMGWYPGFVAQDMAQAAQAAQLYVAAFWGEPDLAVKEVMEFSNQFYVQIEERSTGLGAMELLVERPSGLVHPEPGPNMMWNLKYGHMARGMGMMGRWQGWQAPPAGMPLSPEQAEQLAQQYLDAYMPGAKVTEEITPFYGYYTLDLERAGRIFGMLSVNGFTGQVWYHHWHGQFLGMWEPEGH